MQSARKGAQRTVGAQCLWVDVVGTGSVGHGVRPGRRKCLRYIMDSIKLVSSSGYLRGHQISCVSAPGGELFAACASRVQKET